MPAWRPIKRRDFIRRLRKLGFNGPLRGTRHEFMIHGHYRQAIPSNREFSVPQLRVLIRQVEAILGRTIQASQWDDLG